jgi:hypothetical protein
MLINIALTKEEHAIFTAKWRELIGYSVKKYMKNINEEEINYITTMSASAEQILNAARVIYADYPRILKALAL